MSRTGPSALALPATAVVAMLWLVVACASNGIGAPTNSPTSSPEPPATTTPSVTPSAAPTATATASATATNTPVDTASADPNDSPPAGLLTAGGEPVPGLAGTYCWNSGGMDICADFPAFTDRQPDLPQLTATSTKSKLSFALAGNYPFVSWAASYIEDNGTVVPLGGERSSFDPDANTPSAKPLTAVEFPYPPAGSHSIVTVVVRFANGGDASYGWNVTVP